jgi:fluoroacetyl-CoA thioesterase
MPMKDTLQPGLSHQLRFRISATKTVPALYPEAAEFQAMPDVLATGFLIGLIEWACVLALMPHLDWPREQTLGTHVDVSHEKATPPGTIVTASVRLVAVDGRSLHFEVDAHDGVDTIARGTHERFVVDRDRFDAAVRMKAQRVARDPE